MPDFIDQTGDREQALADAAIANRVQYKGVSAHECESCGSPIPEGRRQHVAGCTECVDCASIGERRR